MSYDLRCTIFSNKILKHIFVEILNTFKNLLIDFPTFNCEKNFYLFLRNTTIIGR